MKKVLYTLLLSALVIGIVANPIIGYCNEKEKSSHTLFDVKSYYRQLSIRYNNIKDAKTDDENIKRCIEYSGRILEDYKENSLTDNYDAAYTDLTYAESYINQAEYQMSLMEGYRELNQLYDSSIIMLQAWDSYKDFATSHKLSVDKETQKYLDKALDVSNKIGGISYFELNTSEIDLIQGQVNEIITYINVKYKEMVKNSDNEFVTA